MSHRDRLLQGGSVQLEAGISQRLSKDSTDLAIGPLSVPPSREDGRALEGLLFSYGFHEYRYVRAFRPALLRRLIQDHILAAAAESSGRVLGAWQGPRLVGILHVKPLPWGTEHFGVRTAEIQHLLVTGAPAQRQRIAARLLKQGLQDEGSECLVHRIDPEDYPTIHALESQGFQLVDTIVHYLCSRRGVKISGTFPLRYPVRPMSVDDIQDLLSLVRLRGFEGRFYHDHRFDRQKADEMYLQWVTQCCHGTLADDVLVAEYRGRVVGFLTYVRLRELERLTGLRIFGRGLLDVSPQHAGAAVDLFRAALVREGRTADFGLFDVRLTNPSMLRLCGAFRMRIAHVRHVFHWWRTPRD